MTWTHFPLMKADWIYIFLIWFFFVKTHLRNKIAKKILIRHTDTETSIKESLADITDFLVSKNPILLNRLVLYLKCVEQACWVLQASLSKVAQINYLSRNQLHCTTNLNFGWMCKKAKHCWALSTNFLFLFSLIMFCFPLNWHKNSNYTSNSCMPKRFNKKELYGIYF